MTHRFNLLLAALIALIALPGYWLLFDNTSARPPAMPLTMIELRDLATKLPGAPPQRIEVETVARRRSAQTFYAAGTGLKTVEIATMAYRLSAADGKAIVINSGTSAVQADTLGLGRFDKAAQARIDAAVLAADKVLVTGIGADRIGGLAALAAQGRLGDNLWLSPPQLNEMLLISGGTSQTYTAHLTGMAIAAVAPGVVVIPTPASVNDQGEMIYVRLADGREYLFCGDVAPLSANWTRLRLHSRLAVPQYGYESRAHDFAWLRTLQALKREAPGLVIVPGREAETLAGAAHFSHGDRSR